MMLARAESNKGPMLLIGLSRRNIEKLIDGYPMEISRLKHGDAIPAGLTIGIIFGETEAEMHATLVKANAIGQKTTITKDQRLEDEEKS